MSKTALKRTKLVQQNGKCDLSGQTLGVETVLFDTHRPTPKRKGGDYTDKNTTVVNPIAHMEEHGTLRIRSEEEIKLKNLIDAREQFTKLRNKVDNQLRAYKRLTDQLDDDVVIELEECSIRNDKLIKKRTKDIEKLMKGMKNPLVKSALGVRAVGPIAIAYCLAYIDLEKARHASSLWAYTGLDKPSHSRYEKGTSGGGNKKLRCILWNMANSQIKLKGSYREVYDRVKARLEVSEKIVISRNTQGKEVKVMWKDTKPCHRHDAALRQVMKHFLADYWFVGRTLAGLPTNPLYAEAILKNGHKTISPEERGWKY